MGDPTTGGGGKPLDPAIRSMIPGFDLTEEIGQGGMGRVFKARQIDMERWVALKILKKALSDDKDYVQRFLGEARTAGKLRHENIVSALDCGAAKGRYYIVMEFVEGRPLDRILKERGTIPEREALAIIRQVATGLGFAWKHRIIHRDIKPQNIMLTAEGTAKICDLGLSRDVRTSSSLTATGIVNCTPTYASPEQARGYKDLDTRSDIYSLGATLYELVTGAPPFEGRSGGDLFIKHATEKPAPPKSRNPQISPEVNRLILQMLDKTREKRPQTPEALTDRINSILSGQEKVVTPRTRRSGARPSGATMRPGVNPLILAGIIGGSALILTLLGILIFGGGDPAPPPKRPPAAVRAPVAPTPVPPRPRPVAQPKEDRVLLALRKLERFARDSKDPAAILMRCDAIRGTFRGTPHEAAFRRIEQRALDQRRLAESTQKVDRLLDETARMIQGDPAFMRYQEIQAMLEAAVKTAGPRQGDVQRALQDYRRHFDTAAQRSAQAIRASISTLAQSKRFHEAKSHIRSYPPSFRSTRYWQDLQSSVAGLDGRITEATDAAITSSKSRRSLRGHESWVLSTTFAPNGSTLVTGSADKTLRFWNGTTGAPLKTLRGHFGMVRSIAFSPDGRLIATGTENFERKPDVPGEVKLWDAATGRMLKSLEGHRAPVYAVAISPDGRVLASGGREPILRLWDLPKGTPRRESRILSSSITTIEFSPDGRLLATAGWYEPVRLWDVATAKDRTLPATKGKRGVVSLAFSPDGRTLATGDKKGALEFWDVGEEKLRISLKGHDKDILALRWSSDGKLLATSGKDLKIKVWDAGTGLLQATLTGHSDKIPALAFSSDGATLASGSHDMTVRLWDVAALLGAPSTPDPSAAATPKPEAPPDPGGIPDGPAAFAVIWKTLVDHADRLKGKPADLGKRGMRGAKYTVKDVTGAGLVLQIAIGGAVVGSTEKRDTLPPALYVSLMRQALPRIPARVRRALIVYLEYRGDARLAAQELRSARGAGIDVADIEQLWKQRAFLANKKQILARAGGGADTEAAVLAGLRWLARHQSEDGGWQAQDYLKECGKAPGTEGPQCSPNPGHSAFDGGVTGLALLAFISAGYTPTSDLKPDGVRFGDVVRKGLDWILANQDPEGCIGSRLEQKFMYNHLICSLPLLEALRLTGAPELRAPAQRAVDFTVGAQNPGLAWRYSTRSNDNDSSVAGWAVKVLHLAELCGLSYPTSSTSGTRAWFARVTDEFGRVGYTKKNTGKVFVPGLNESFNHHETLAAIGMIVKVYIEKNTTHPVHAKAMKLLLKDKPWWGSKSTDFYYWYYGSEAIYLVEGASGANWRVWNTAMKSALLNAQSKATGCRAGSWEPVGRWSGEGGRVYGTAMNVLTLETYYRVGGGAK